MNTLTDTTRALLAAVLLAVTIGFGAMAALASTSSASSTDESARPFVYYRCYVQGYGWMYCTDRAHA